MPSIERTPIISFDDKQRLMDIRNEELNSQLNELSDINNEITTKQRIVDLNQDYTKRENYRIRVLGAIIITVLILLIPVGLFALGVIDMMIMLILVGLIIIGFIVYVVVVRERKREFKAKPVSTKLSSYEKALMRTLGDDVKYLRNDLGNYTDTDCVYDENSGIPVKEEESETYDRILPKDRVLNKNQGFYYYDGSAPPQLIYPKPEGKLTLSDNNYNNVQIPTNDTNFDKLSFENPFKKMYYKMINDNQNGPNYKLNENDKNMTLIDWVAGRNMGISDSSKGMASPNWPSVGLPMVSKKTKNKVLNICQKYNDPITPPQIGSFIVDAYNLVYNEEIPKNKYEQELKKLENKIKGEFNTLTNSYNQKKVNDIYSNYVMELLNQKFNNNLNPVLNSDYKCWVDNTINNLNSNISNNYTPTQMTD